MKRFFVAVILCCCLASLDWAAEPSFPNYSGFVNDFANVLDSSTTAKLEGLCRALEKKTSAELAIAVVKTAAPLDPKTYAVKLFEKWKIGKKGKDNGILILLAMEERRVEIEVGYGLEGTINDARAGEILDKYVIPFFKQGKFGEGLYNGAAAIAGRIAETSGQEMGEEYQAKRSVSKDPGEGWFTTIAIIAVVAIVLLSILGMGIASGLFGAVFGAFIGYAFLGIIGAIVGAVFGFMLSYSKFPTSRFGGGGGWGGGFGGGWSSGGGGGGGFGGGSSGGGGAGRSW